LRDDMVLDYVDTAAYLQATPRQIVRWIDEGRLGCILLHARARRVLGRHVREFIAAAEERTPSPAPIAGPKIRPRSAAKNRRRGVSD
jgi:hypothetical protein